MPFNLFKSKARITKETRTNTLYSDCIREIEEYIDSHQNPTWDDLLKISINARITYLLFKSETSIQSKAKKTLLPLIINGLALFIEEKNMTEEQAAAELQEIYKITYNELLEKNHSDLTLPAIERAFVIKITLGE